MSWILDHLNIVIVGILVLGSFLKSRIDSLKQEEQQSDDIPDFGGDRESERRAPSSAPYVPPPVERRPPPMPAQRSAGNAPVFAATRSQSGAMTKSADEAAVVLKKQREIEERMRVIRETRSTKGGAKPPVRTRAGTGKPVAVASVPTSIRSRLRKPSELRRAFVMREILDPPVGLR